MVFFQSVLGIGLVEVERRLKRELLSNRGPTDEGAGKVRWERYDGKVRLERCDWGDETIGRVELLA